MTVRVLLADDERPARLKLRAHLARVRDAEIVGEAADGPATVRAIGELAPDLVFLDVQMPGLDGFEVIDAIGVERMPVVVFVTAFDRYALDAFAVEAVDYLLKPYDQMRFLRAWERCLGHLLDRQSGRRCLARLLVELPRHGRFLERLSFRDGERTRLVAVGEVEQLRSAGNYVEVHVGPQRHLIRDTLARLEARLDPGRFARIHRSAIVNLDRVREILPFSHGDRIVVLASGQRTRLSRRYRSRLLGEQEESP